MIGVYGATGMLGRLVTARFDRAGAPTTVIGRSQAAVDRLAPAATLHRTAVAAIDDPAALEQAIDGCQVLVNCAPAAPCGERLVRAALDAGIHYVDAAGEQQHIRTLFERYDDEATQCDAAVVPALGFDYAIGDCLAHLAAQSHQPARDVVIAYAIEGSKANGNDAQAAATAAKEVVYRDGRWRTVPFELDRAWFTFPDPVGPRQMSRYGSGEVITVPHHVKTQAVSTLITSTALCPYPALLPVFPFVRPIVGLVRRTPARAVLAAVAGVLGRSKSRDADTTAEGAAPSRDDRRFMIAAEVHSLAGSTGRAVAVGGNFLDVTAAILAQGALWLAEGSVVAGVHSAATAFEPHALLDALAADGVTWSQSG
jgi:short subunit dehydrogenase-like uncharacterized protein